MSILRSVTPWKGRMDRKNGAAAGMAPTIMVIRHAEKPAAAYAGVNEAGISGNRDLIVRGWQRAGALAVLFGPARGMMQNPLLARPGYLFASAAADAKSQRSEQTLLPLSRVLGVPLNLDYSKGNESALVKRVLACDRPVLIAWQHENISAIAKAIPGGEGVPRWPSVRFDVIFVFTLDPLKGTYRFAQVPQLLLGGDSADLID